VPRLRVAGGAIVNLSAASGRVTVPMAGPISASKSELESVSDALRMELKHHRVKVVVVEPGVMQTEIFDKAARAAPADGFAGAADTQRRYAAAIEAAEKASASMKPRPVDGVVKSVVNAQSSERPASRYVAGGTRASS
jgi:NAD(P)-dependent dehydrogenase (short-subunit alcohol dehydrogenase family)